jgi:NTP pyrophosphatase (non-canonical NTP hydrolase)|tara:strand:+ start:46 stop:312 length:267 start_codon:yes stop_codon:yes gene_type:complete
MKEILTILNEECAEVIQCSAKLQRFGVNDEKNQKKLEAELGDVMAMMLILNYYGMVERTAIEKQIKRKLKKLKRFSQIECIDEVLKEL